jgi:hypothetical protein
MWVPKLAFLVELEVLSRLLDQSTLPGAGRAVSVALSNQKGLPSALSINKENNHSDSDLRPVRMGFAILGRDDYWGYWLMIVLEVGDLFWGTRKILDMKVVDSPVPQSDLPARRPGGCGLSCKAYSLFLFVEPTYNLDTLDNGQLVFYLFQLIQAITGGNKHLLPFLLLEVVIFLKVPRIHLLLLTASVH